jgi:hypothetical protein
VRGVKVCATRPNGALVVSVNSQIASNTRASGALAGEALFISNGLNPTSASAFARVEGAWIMDHSLGGTVAGVPGMLGADWKTFGDTTVATSSPTGQGLNVANRLLLSTLMNRRIPLTGMGGGFSDDVNSVVVYRSDDCGGSWRHCVIPNPPHFDERIAAGYAVFLDQPYMYVDPDDTKRVYVIVKSVFPVAPPPGHESEGTIPQSFFLATSLDGGANFSAFAPLIDPSGNYLSEANGFFPIIQTTRPNGTLVMVWEDQADACPEGVRDAYNFNTWRSAVSYDRGAHWQNVSVISSGFSRCRATQGDDLSYLGVRNSRRRAGFVIAANNHCVVAVTELVGGSEQVRVFTSGDGIVWNLSFKVPVGANMSAPNRDMFLPVLSHNIYDRYDPHVVMSWYDTRESPDGTGAAIYSLTSLSNASIGTWEGESSDSVRSRVIAGRISGAPRRILANPGTDRLGKIGEYWGVSPYLSGTETRFFFAWMTSSATLVGGLPIPTIEVRTGGLVDMP